MKPQIMKYISAFLIVLALIISVPRAFRSKQKAAPLSDFYKGLEEGQRIGFKDGIFWGSLAVAEGATNLDDAETRAYRMRSEAEARVREHRKELTNITNSLH